MDLSLVKKHCRVDFTDDDDLINAYIDAGVLWVENTTDRTIFPRAHKWVLSGFPDGRVRTFQLPRGLTQSIASVKYTAGGVLTTLDLPRVGQGHQLARDLRRDTQHQVAQGSSGSECSGVNKGLLDQLTAAFAVLILGQQCQGVLTTRPGFLIIRRGAA